MKYNKEKLALEERSAELLRHEEMGFDNMDEAERKKLIEKKEEEVEWWRNIKDESAHK